MIFSWGKIRAGFIPDPSKAWVVLAGHIDSVAFQMSVRFKKSDEHSNSTYFYAFNLSGKKLFYISF